MLSTNMFIFSITHSSATNCRKAHGFMDRELGNLVFVTDSRLGSRIIHQYINYRNSKYTKTLTQILVNLTGDAQQLEWGITHKMMLTLL